MIELKREIVIKQIALVICDVLVSGFAGLLMFWMIEHQTGSREMTALMCLSISLSGWLGGNAIGILTNIWKAALRISIDEKEKL